jgi:hypothetical protein
LIDLDLVLDHHVIDESDESSKGVVVSLGKLKDSVLGQLFFFHLIHGLVLHFLSSFGLVEVFFFSEVLAVCYCSSELFQILDDFIDGIVIFNFS